MAEFTRKRTSRKAADRPKKPYAEFPLYAHPLGYWSKKIRGTIRHFGRWGRVVKGKLTRLPGDGWEQALHVYKAAVDDIQSGRVDDAPVVLPPEQRTGPLTIRDLANKFLNAKLARLQAGRMTKRSFDEYKATTDRLIRMFGKARTVESLRPADFEALLSDISKTWGVVRLGNEIGRVNSLFKYGRDNGLILQPVVFGSEFKKPSKKELRLHKAKQGKRLFTAEEIRKLLESASVPMRAMILFGINCGFGGSDCASLPQTAVDLEKGWVNFPRPKTGVERRCPLWPETADALKAASAERPEPRSEAHAGLCFLTSRREPWVRTTETSRTDAVTVQFGKLLRRLEINGRKGLGFYSLRHTFRTVADATKDFPAIRLVMGHADGSIDDTYRETIDDDRLVAVADFVRQWLFGANDGTTAPEGGAQ